MIFLFCMCLLEKEIVKMNLFVFIPGIAAIKVFNNLYLVDCITDNAFLCVIFHLFSSAIHFFFLYFRSFYSRNKIVYFIAF